jgi:hypothetical protein
MYTRSPRYIALLIVPALAVAAACGNHAPASPTAPAAIESALITAEPMTAKPEFLPLSFCPAGPPFGFRLVLTVGSGRNSFFLRRLLFNFTDRFGGFSVPTVTPIPTTRIGSIPDSTPIPFPTSPSIPLPTSSAIPIPGSLSLEDGRIAAGVSRTQAVFVQFGCGVAPGGTLVVIVDGTDSNGAAVKSSIRVRVGD